MRTPRLDETGDVEPDDGVDASAAALSARCANDSERADLAATIVGGGDDVRTLCRLPVELFMALGGDTTLTGAALDIVVVVVVATSGRGLPALGSVELDAVPDSPSTMPST